MYFRKDVTNYNSSCSEPFSGVRLSQNPHKDDGLYRVESGCLIVLYELFSFVQIFRKCTREQKHKHFCVPVRSSLLLADS